MQMAVVGEASHQVRRGGADLLVEGLQGRFAALCHDLGKEVMQREPALVRGAIGFEVCAVGAHGMAIGKGGAETWPIFGVKMQERAGGQLYFAGVHHLVLEDIVDFDGDIGPGAVDHFARHMGEKPGVEQATIGRVDRGGFAVARGAGQGEGFKVGDAGRAFFGAVFIGHQRLLGAGAGAERLRWQIGEGLRQGHPWPE